MTVHVAHERPENAGVLRYLGPGRGLEHLPVGEPADGADRLHLGTHPLVVARLWDVLNAELPTDGRCVIYGSPALVEPQSGVVLAVGIGTQYALRLRPDDRMLALGSGASRENKILVWLGAEGRAGRRRAIDRLVRA